MLSPKDLISLASTLKGLEGVSEVFGQGTGKNVAAGLGIDLFDVGVDKVNLIKYGRDYEHKTFKSFEEPSLNLYSTVLKIFLALSLGIDFSILISLYGSPSSTSNSDLITESFVTVFPIMFTLST